MNAVMRDLLFAGAALDNFIFDTCNSFLFTYVFFLADRDAQHSAAVIEVDDIEVTVGRGGSSFAISSDLFSRAILFPLATLVDKAFGNSTAASRLPHINIVDYVANDGSNYRHLIKTCNGRERISRRAINNCRRPVESRSFLTRKPEILELRLSINAFNAESLFTAW